MPSSHFHYGPNDHSEWREEGVVVQQHPSLVMVMEMMEWGDAAGAAAACAVQICGWMGGVYVSVSGPPVCEKKAKKAQKTKTGGLVFCNLYSLRAPFSLRCLPK
jgi:hypothetical protein